MAMKEGSMRRPDVMQWLPNYRELGFSFETGEDIARACDRQQRFDGNLPKAAIVERVLADLANGEKVGRVMCDGCDSWVPDCPFPQADDDDGWAHEALVHAADCPMVATRGRQRSWS
jgi:hypothetical protein